MVGGGVAQQDDFNDIQWVVAKEGLDNPQLNHEDVEPNIIAAHLDNNDDDIASTKDEESDNAYLISDDNTSSDDYFSR